MAVVRVTPATALQQMRQLGSELPRLLTDAGSLSAAPQLPRQVDALLAASAGTARLPIEVWVDDGTTFEEAAAWLVGDQPTEEIERGAHHVAIAARLGPKPIALHVTRSSTPIPYSPGQVAANVLVWLCGDEPPESAPIEDRAVVIVTSRASAWRAGAEIAREPLVVDRGAPAGVLARAFGAPPLGQAIDLMHADAVARAIEQLLAIAGIAFEQELRGIRAKRALTQQRAADLQMRQSSSPQGDVIGTIRSRLQRMFGDFARGVDDRFSSALTAPTSPLWQSLEERFAAIDSLDREERLKTVATKIAPDVEADWQDALRSAIRQHGLADLGALRDMLRSAAQEVETLLAQAGGPPVVMQFQYMAGDRLERLLDTHVIAQRKYQGEMPRHGLFEYLNMARRYQTLAFMLLSAFGLSFLRSYRDFMVPVVFALLAIGVLQMIHNVRRERVELADKELEKIRELLRVESRRILGEVQRAWSALIAQQLNDQLPLIVPQVESAVREHAARAANEGAEERQRLQRQLQTFEASERKLMVPQKARESMAQAVAQARGELRQLIAATAMGAVA